MQKVEPLTDAEKAALAHYAADQGLTPQEWTDYEVRASIGMYAAGARIPAEGGMGRLAETDKVVR